MKVSDIRWLYFRLRAMSAGEVAHRLREQAKRTYDSRRAFRFDSSTIELPIIPGLRERVRACSDVARGQFRAVADEIRGGHYHFLGQDWPKTDGLPDWHLDPISVKRWPSDVFCYSVPFRHNRDLGDVKYVWELNRLQHLQFVAAAAACDDDPELAKLCVAQIRSWIDSNPPFKGLNWSSGIELSLRIVSFIIVFSLIPHSTFSQEDLRAIGSSVRAHFYWLKRYPSRYSSANNHFIAEAAGLFLMSLLLPELPKAKDIRRYARKALNAEALLQFYADGVPAEQSPTYGAFSAEWILCAHAVARAVGDQGLTTMALERLGEFGTFLSWITDKSGNVPRIGDDDEGRVIFGREPSSQYLGLINRATKSVERDKSVIAGTFESLRNAVLFVASACENLTSKGLIGVTGVRTFPLGGYTVARDRVSGKECLLVLDHGPLGYLGIAAHGHADALAIWAHFDGQPVLVDAGTYLYHSGAMWREHFRGTSAHSTLLLADSDQSIQSGEFNWSSKANARLVSARDNIETFRVAAKHDGYLKRFGIVHVRSITRKGSGQYAVEDLLLSHRPITIDAEIGFLVSGDLDVNTSSDGWTISAGGTLLMSIHCPAALERNIQQISEGTRILGWMSTAFGSKTCAFRLVARFNRSVPRLVSEITFGPEVTNRRC